MVDNNVILNNFGKYLMQYCRDRTLDTVSEIILGKIKSPNHKAVGEALQDLTPAEKKAVEDVAKLLFNESFFQFEQFLNEHTEYKLMYIDGDASIDLLDVSDGLFGEMVGDDGWIEKYSSFDGKDFF